MNVSLLPIATDCSMDSRDNQEATFDISFKDLLQIELDGKISSNKLNIDKIIQDFKTST